MNDTRRQTDGDRCNTAIYGAVLKCEIECAGNLRSGSRDQEHLHGKRPQRTLKLTSSEISQSSTTITGRPPPRPPVRRKGP